MGTEGIRRPSPSASSSSSPSAALGSPPGRPVRRPCLAMVGVEDSEDLGTQVRFSPGPTGWESNPKRQGGSRRAVPPAHQGIWPSATAVGEDLRPSTSDVGSWSKFINYLQDAAGARNLVFDLAVKQIWQFSAAPPEQLANPPPGPRCTAARCCTQKDQCLPRTIC